MIVLKSDFPLSHQTSYVLVEYAHLKTYHFKAQWKMHMYCDVLIQFFNDFMELTSSIIAPFSKICFFSKDILCASHKIFTGKG